MTDQSRLVKRVAWALHAVRNSNGWEDTAEQLVESLRDLLPDEISAAETIADLQGEINSLRFARDSAVIQLKAHIARSQRKVQP